MSEDKLNIVVKSSSIRFLEFNLRGSKFAKIPALYEDYKIKYSKYHLYFSPLGLRGNINVYFEIILETAFATEDAHGKIYVPAFDVMTEGDIELGFFCRYGLNLEEFFILEKNRIEILKKQCSKFVIDFGMEKIDELIRIGKFKSLLHMKDKQGLFNAEDLDDKCIEYRPNALKLTIENSFEPGVRMVFRERN